MRLKQASELDQDTIHSLSGKRIKDSTLSYQDLHDYLNDRNMGVYLLEDNGLVLGYLILRFETEEGEIDEIAVRKEEEGKGLGTLMLKESTEIFLRRGIEKVFLEVRKKNEKAIHLYEKNGFVLYRTRKNYYADDDALCYVKELNHER